MANWLDYTIINNEEGVLGVLRRHGCPDPASEQELRQASYHLVKNSEQGTIDLLREHPDVDVLSDLFKEKNNYKNFEEGNGTASTEVVNSTPENQNLKEEILNQLKLENLEKRWESMNNNVKIAIAVILALVVYKLLFEKKVK